MKMNEFHIDDFVVYRECIYQLKVISGNKAAGQLKYNQLGMKYPTSSDTLYKIDLDYVKPVIEGIDDLIVHYQTAIDRLTKIKSNS